MEPLDLKAADPSPKQKYPSQAFISGLKPLGFLRRVLSIIIGGKALTPHQGRKIL